MILRSLVILFLISTTTLVSQRFNAENIQKSNTIILEQKFKKFQLVKLDLPAIHASLNLRGSVFPLKITGENINWDLTLSEFEIYKSDYISLVGRNGKVEKSNQKRTRAFKATNNSARSKMSCFTSAENFFYGYVEEAGVKRFIEPLSYYLPGSSSNEFILYYETDAKPVEGITCGADALEENKHRHDDQVLNNLRAGCITVDIALSCDKNLHDKRGGVNGADAFMNTILILVGTNYDNEFSTAIEFSVSATFIPTTTADDPWNGINNIDAQLTTHRNWANGGGYGGAAYGVATNWTPKFTSGAIGLAYVGAMCGSFRYNVCSDYGGANGLLRCLQAHELGHNFGAGHDNAGSGFIMAPSVSNSVTWSPASITAISNTANSMGCKSICNAGDPPVADFSGVPEIVCPNGVVKFTDESLNIPTQWQWTFPGGTPSSSTLQNPTIVYKTTGTYDVTLKVTSNFGNNTKTITKYIQVLPLVSTSFSSFTIDRDLYTTNASQNADSYLWKFGDGNTSTEDEPIHTYAKDGTYTVELCATNTCGTICKKQTVNVVTPCEAGFTADIQDGCTSFKVKYRNLSSSNSTAFAWSFPGGVPSISSDKEPTITYANKGVFDAKLTASNSKYSNTKVEKAFIRAESLPNGDFDHKAPLGNSIEFTNLTIDTIVPWKYKWLWNFGDTKTSTEKNPTHTFSKSGTYKVCLYIDNGCGKDTVCKDVNLSGVLNAGFTVQPSKGCVPFVVDFKNTSSGATAYKWLFPGGSPSTSTDVNPKITYSSIGNYDVSLVAYSGSDSSIVKQNSLLFVNDKPTAKFDLSVSRFTVKFTNKSLRGTTYFWNFGDNTTSTEQNPEHVYKSEGEFDVELTVTNECGETKIKTKSIVYLIPKISFAMNNTIICAGDFVQFVDQSSKDVNDWKWQIEGANPNTSSEQNPKVRFMKPGIYTVKLTVKNTNGENSLTKTGFMHVKSAVFCPDRGGKGNNVPVIEGEENEIVTERLKTYSSNTSIQPNPSTGMIVLEIPRGMLTQDIQIFNANGIQVDPNQEKKLNSTRTEYDLNSLENGLYLFNITTESGIITKKFVILR